MLCEKCKNNVATMHIKSVINGVVTEKHLCSNCYNGDSFSKSNLSIDDILVSLFDEPVKSKKILRCPSCNSSIEDISSTGKLGCSECYKTFRDTLLPYIKRVHGSNTHIGKVPNTESESVKTKVDSAEALKIQLKKLISEEKFEEAAVIRDKIKEIERNEA